MQHKDILESTIEKKLTFAQSSNHFDIFSNGTAVYFGDMIIVTDDPAADNQRFIDAFKDINNQAQGSYYVPIEFKSTVKKTSQYMLVHIEIDQQIKLTTYDYHSQNESLDSRATLKKLITDTFKQTIQDADFVQVHTSMENDKIFSNERLKGKISVFSLLMMYTASLISTNRIETNYYKLKQTFSDFFNTETSQPQKQVASKPNNDKSNAGTPYKNKTNVGKVEGGKAPFLQPKASGYAMGWRTMRPNYEVIRVKAEKQKDEQVKKVPNVNKNDRPKNTTLIRQVSKSNSVPVITSHKSQHLDPVPVYKKSESKAKPKPKSSPQDILLNYLKIQIDRLGCETNPNKTAKLSSLQQIRADLMNGTHSVKESITAIKAVTLSHRETKENATFNFYLKFNWLRNTKSYGDLLKIIDKNDDIKPKLL